jgi:hypothetical protein
LYDDLLNRLTNIYIKIPDQNFIIEYIIKHKWSHRKSGRERSLSGAISARYASVWMGTS